MSDIGIAPDIFEFIKEILKANGICSSVKKVEFIDCGKKGENTESWTQSLKVIFEEDGISPLHLFAKREFAHPKKKEMLEKWQVFYKEAEFYMEYLPEAKKYLETVGKPNLLRIYPKCFHGDSKLLVFENLVERGYSILEDQEDFETAKLSLINLAKHHAISYAVVTEAGGPEVFFEKFQKLKFEPLKREGVAKGMQAHFDSVLDTNILIVEKAGLHEGREAIKKMKTIKGIGFGEVLKSLDGDGQLQVLNHGDYWGNNIMFKKREQIIVDFQVVRYGSPCIDLSYFLFTSVKAEVRREKIKDLFTIYLKTFKEIVNDLGHFVQYEMEELERDFIQHFYFGWWFGLVITTGVGKEVFDEIDTERVMTSEEFVKETERQVKKFLKNNPDECEERAKIIIGFVKEYELLQSGILFQ